MSEHQAFKQGNISIDAQNIMPVIKRWLYSDKDIFIRELVSNGVDAISKYRMMGKGGDEDLRVTVTVDKEAGIISFTDNGIGMTAEEVDRYINQVAFSSAEEFLKNYTAGDQSGIIGHFGLGFYSSFMAASKVTIDTLSWQENAAPVLWESEDGMAFSMSEGERQTRGTTITLTISEEEKEFLDGFRTREVLNRYCGYMSVPIYFVDIEAEKRAEEAAKKDDKKADKVEKSAPAPINDTNPIWLKAPKDVTVEEYKDTYRKLFNTFEDPLFWVHLNVDYPFNLKGILYFPRIKRDLAGQEGEIKLFNRQVFVADNIKEVIPEFLMLLKGVIDCPDLPLNVSRSALQNDGFVKKISDYITKKVADKLSGMCKTQKEEYEKYWDDIAPFIKFGCLKDEKFCEKMTDYILFKNLDGKYMTLPECLEVNKTDPDETQEGAVDENGEKVEAEVVEDKSEDSAEEEKKDKTIYYVTDEKQQSQYINMFKAAKMDAVMLTDRIDQPFISQLEAKNEGIHFARIDADLTDAFKTKTSKKTQEELNAQAEKVEKLVQKALKNDKIKVKIEKLKNKKVSSVLTVSEESRRMQDMMKMYGGGMDMSMFGAEGETLVLNANHPLVTYITEHEDDANTKMICEQLYDLAKLQNAPLSPEAMTKFVARSNDIMLLLAK